MMDTSGGQPILINALEDGLASEGRGVGQGVVFDRVPVEDALIGESWLQRVLFEHPELLPIGELDQMFAPVRPLAREVSTGVGAIDLLAVSPSEVLTIVETKLHRNPESRREVLGQILDYCGQISQWSYAQLVDAVCSSKHRSNDAKDPVLVAGKGEASSIADQKRFRATVSESLRHGRFLMMIVGDSFREQTSDLLEYVQKSMHLQFTIRLVELRLYRPRGKAAFPVLVVPHLAARTREVTRAIVRIQHHVNPADVNIEGVIDQETSPGLEEFVEHLTKVHGIGNEFASLVTELASWGIYADPTKDGVQLRWPDPHGSGQHFRVLRARRNGDARVNRIKLQLDHVGYDSSPALRYISTVAAWVPDTTVDADGRILASNGALKDVPLRTLVADRRAEFVEALQRLLDDIRATANTSTEGTAANSAVGLAERLPQVPKP